MLRICPTCAHEILNIMLFVLIVKKVLLPQNIVKTTNLTTMLVMGLIQVMMISNLKGV